MTTKEYNQTVDNHSDGLFRFALKTLKDKMQAEDIVQEAFARLWEKKDTVQDGKAKSYLFQTAYNLMVDFFRNEKKYTDSIPPERSEKAFAPHDIQHVLNQALDKLPDIQKTVLLLRDYEGYNYQEIGEITALTESQVKVYIFRARTAMKEYLGSIHHLI